MSSPSSPSGGLTIVKFGGSVITRKQKDERLRPKVLARLARELATSPGPTILLHGAGSFGHPGAVRFGLAQAPNNGASGSHRTRGASIVATEVRRLHLAVLQALVRAKSCPFSIPPATLARNVEGRLAGLDAQPFERAVARGQLSVSFGDVVPDEAWGHSILSADTIAVDLARRLQARRVVFVSDVPGVFDPALYPRRVVVPKLDNSIADRLGTGAGGPDVTGGIRGKVRAMLAIGAAGTDAGLVSGLRDGALTEALRGETAGGSWVAASGIPAP
jgi:isopentenyl phosphate kinase